MRGQHLLIGLICLTLFSQGRPNFTSGEMDTRVQAASLRKRIEAAPRLPLEQSGLLIKLPKGHNLGMVSWLAHDPKTGMTWVIQRGDKADPVIALDWKGRVLHSFGKGLS
jgi:hypothetical protein